MVMRLLLIGCICLFIHTSAFSQVSIVVNGIIFSIPGKTGGELMGKTGNPATIEGFYAIDTTQRTLTSTVVKRFEDFETNDNVDVDQYTIHFEDIDLNEVFEIPIYDDGTFKTPHYYADFMANDLNESIEHFACIHGTGSEQLTLAESPLWIRFYFLEEEEATAFIQSIRTTLNLK